MRGKGGGTALGDIPRPQPSAGGRASREREGPEGAPDFKRAAALDIHKGTQGDIQGALSLQHDDGGR